MDANEVFSFLRGIGLMSIKPQILGKSFEHFQIEVDMGRDVHLHFDGDCIFEHCGFFGVFFFN